MKSSQVETIAEYAEFLLEQVATQVGTPLFDMLKDKTDIPPTAPTSQLVKLLIIQEFLPLCNQQD